MGFQYYGHLKAGSPLYQNRQLIDKLLIRQGTLIETDHLLSYIGKEVTCYAIVYGGRQTGKTSLIQHLRAQIKDRDLGSPCWVDFQRSIGSSAEDTLLFLARQIVEQVPELQGVEPPQKFSFGGLEFDRWLANQPFEKPLAIFMDELGWLPRESRQKLGGILRGMHEHRQGSRLEKVMCFFFGGIELHEMAVIDVSPLNNICETYMLADLSPDATANLLQAGFGPGAGLDFQRLAEMVFQQVAGQPYLTQLFGKMLQSQHLEKNPGAMEEMVRSTGELLMDDHYLDHAYQTIIEYKLQEACKSLFERPNYSSFQDDWTKLLLLGTARVKDRRMGISNTLLERVLQERIQSASAAHTPNRTVESSVSHTTQVINTQGGPYIQGNLSTEGGDFVGRDQAKEQEEWMKRPSGPGDLAPFSARTMAMIEKESALTYLRRRNEILDKIVAFPCLRDIKEREVIFSRAALAPYRSVMDLSGEPEAAVPRMFFILEQQERNHNGLFALGLFLFEIIGQTGPEEQRQIRSFIDQYGLL